MGTALEGGEGGEVNAGGGTSTEKKRLGEGWVGTFRIHVNVHFICAILSGLLLRDTLSVALDAHPGQALRRKLLYSVRPKCHPLLYGS